jgi:hypothetical protein
MDGRNIPRRAFLGSVGGAAGGLVLAGRTAGRDPDPGAVRPSGTGARSLSATDCTPGHTAGDSPCKQIEDDAAVLVPFEAAGTALPVTFDYPCGWTTGTTGQFDDRFQANATRSAIGDHHAAVDLQVRAYTEPVGEDFIESTRSDGEFETVDYGFADQTRTGLVSSVDTAEFGTTAHAVVPFLGTRLHVEVVSSLKSRHCDVDPPPDYDLVRDALGSLDPNPETSFPDYSDHFEVDHGHGPSARIVAPLEEGTVVVKQEPEQRIRGKTSHADGTGLTMTIRSDGIPTGSPILRTVGADDQSSMQVTDGEFSAAVDFSDVVVGQEFTVTVQQGSDVHATKSGRVVQAPSVSIENQRSADGQAVLVDGAVLPEGGFVLLHDEQGLAAGDAVGSVIGISSHLSPGSHQRISVTLASPLQDGRTGVVAGVYRDSNGNGLSDFVSTDGNDDGPYQIDGERVVDAAVVTVPTPTTTTEPTPTPTPTSTTPTRTTTPPTTITSTRQGGEAGDEEGDDDPGTVDGGGDGFGIVAAVAGLAAAAKLAIHRD